MNKIDRIKKKLVSAVRFSHITSAIGLIVTIIWIFIGKKVLFERTLWSIGIMFLGISFGIEIVKNSINEILNEENRDDNDE